LFNSYNQTHRIGLARVNIDGTVDTSFMDTSYNQFAGVPNEYWNADYQARNFIFATAIQSDGNVLVSGSAQTINNWVNRAAFANAPDNRFGNAPVGDVEAPGLEIFNLSVSKNFAIGERFRLRYQADFFNAFNMSNFTGLNTNLASAAFGTLPTAYPPRNIQMQLKLTF